MQNKKRFFPQCCYITLISILAGCGTWLKSNHERPTVSLPSQWKVPATTNHVIVNTQQPWWYGFNDAQLNLLIDKALATNNNLAKAMLKVQQARLRANLSDTNTIGVSAGAQGTTSKDLGSSTQSTRGYGSNLSLSYALDLWGRFARTQDMAQWEAQATELDRQSIALELIATTVQLYWRIAYLNQKITIIERSIEHAQRLLDLVEVRYRAGATNLLDKIQAQRVVIDQQNLLILQKEEREKLRNAFAILFDQHPQHREIERTTLSITHLPDIPIGLPADLLARRPDLHAAEFRLRKALAHVDQTKLRFYPSLTLTGALGTSSNTLTSILHNPIGSLALNMALPFVEWHTFRIDTQVAQLDYQQAVIEFRETLYKALKDVDDALLARTQYRESARLHQREFEYATQSEKIAEVRYRAGQTSIKEWLDQQEAKRQAEFVLVENYYHQLTNLTKLYQALGE